MKILLTGGTGKLGRTVAARLAEEDEIIHFSRRDPEDGHRWIEGDIRDREALTDACDGVSAIIHAAALHTASWKAAGDDAAFQVNVNGTRNVLEAAVSAGVSRVVFASSVYAAGHGPGTETLPHTEASTLAPCERYGLTKHLAEELCAWYAARQNLSVIVLRPGYILDAEPYNPQEPMLLYGGVNVRDVAEAHRLALYLPESVRHETCIIVADSPLAGVSRAEYTANPKAALRRVLPEIGPMLDDGSFDPEALPAWFGADWYSNARAKAVLGFHPRFNFSPCSGNPGATSAIQSKPIA